MINRAILFLPLFLVSMLTAQTPYHPMLVEGRSWDVFTAPTELSICPYIYATHLFLNGDTIYDGIKYKKLAYNHIRSSPEAPFCTGFYRDTSEAYSYYAFYREDTLARKVYMRMPDVPEFAVFDFSLQAGDTLHYPNQSYPIQEITDWVLDNGEHRKAFKIGEWQNHNYYVEGIGYLLGAFDPVYYPFEGWNATSCVRDSGVVLYSTGYPGCILATSATQMPDIQGLEISPNPFSKQLILKIPERQSGAVFLFELYDLTGRVVFRKEIDQGTSSQTLDLPPLPKGGYFWAINGVAQGKLIKI